jgi:hypothetical protein
MKNHLLREALEARLQSAFLPSVLDRAFRGEL